MKCRCALLLSLLLGWMAAFATGANPVAMTAFLGATVIDGTGKSPRPDAVVLVAGERIAAVGSRDEVSIPEGARMIDVHGKWIVPGLIDAHVHFFQSGGLYTRPDVIDLRRFRPYAEEIARIKERIPQTFARFLASGVTGVADFGGPLWTFEVRRLARHTIAAPRMVAAGPLLATYAPAALRLHDRPVIKVNSPRDARSLVRWELAYRPDFIKIWFIPLPDESLDQQTEWVRAAIEESHAAGLRVVVHATQFDVARRAVSAGADILAHSIDNHRVDDEFIRLLKDRNVVYVSGLAVNEGYEEVLGEKVQLTEIERRLGDPEAIHSFGDLAWLPVQRKGTAYFWPSREISFANLKRLQQSGVTIAAGSDAGNIGTLPGPALHREFELMAEAGLSPQEILAAATRGGARAMGLESDIGTLEKGKLADFLVLDADPLADIRNLRSIERVVKGGALFDPGRLMQ